jgi:hypothetical protein
VSSIGALGPSPVVSRDFSAAGIWAPSGQLLLDVYIPTAAGSIDVQVKIPSEGIRFEVSLGDQPLAGKPTNAYSTLRYAVPENVLTALASAPSDVRLSIVFNMPLNAGTFFLDNLRFE